MEIRSAPRVPAVAADLGIAVDDGRLGTLRAGDSLMHGFQSGAIFNADLSYPAVIAHELCRTDYFRHPRYPRPRRHPTESRNPDYGAYARACGADARTVKTLDGAKPRSARASAQAGRP